MSLTRQRLDRLAKRLAREKSGPTCGQYAHDPVGYAREVLGVTLWERQAEALRLLLVPPYKVLVRAGHSVGKSLAAACATLWLHDCHKPGIVLTTAPTEFSVKNILWKEIRRLRARRGGWAGPRICRLESAPDHFAQGFTARDATAFQGHHNRGGIWIVFDEAVGVASPFWEAARTMLTGERYGFLAIYNPTDSSSQARAEEQSGDYHVVTMSCLDHPNLTAELAGKPPPFPSAIRLQAFEDMLYAWSTRLGPQEEPTEQDVEWPPHSASWYRPGPVAEARLLGRWPMQGTSSVWTEALWLRAARAGRDVQERWRIVIGCDVARFGDDATAIAVRKGCALVHVETHQGWSTAQTAARLKQLCHELAPETPRQVACHIDVCGLGAGVVDAGAGYRFVGVNSASRAALADKYHNLRTELWFNLVELARADLVDCSRLPKPLATELQRQLLAPRYVLDAAGRIELERKEQTKRRLKCSPDLADAVNLAFLRADPPREKVAGRIA